MTLVVWTADLVKILRDFKENSDVSAVSESLRRRVNALLDEAEQKPLTLFFERADPLVTAIGKPHLFSTGVLTVFNVGLAPEVIRLGKPALRKRRWARKDRPRKKCPGLFCQGQARPLSKFYLNQRGRDKGKPRTYCKECDQIYSRRYQEKWKLHHPDFYRRYWREKNIKKRKSKWEHYGLCSYKEVGPAIEELCSRLGPTRVAVRLEVPYPTVWRWRKGLVDSIHLEYAARIWKEYLKVLNRDERLTPAQKRHGKGVKIEIERGERGRIVRSRWVREITTDV